MFDYEPHKMIILVAVCCWEQYQMLYKNQEAPNLPARVDPWHIRCRQQGYLVVFVKSSHATHSAGLFR